MRRITNVRFPKPLNSSKESDLWQISLAENGCISDLQPMVADTVISSESWEGDWISPMGIDLQINGGLGLAFNELKEKDLPRLFELLEHLWTDGIEGICPTIVTCEINDLRQALLTLQNARKKSLPNQCELLGAHLEGPFIAKEKRGAHPLKKICSPSLSELEKRISGFENDIDLMTIAPELSGSFDLISKLLDLEIIVSLGHSTADKQIASQAFSQGIKMITHSFNAMNGIHHRDPGPIVEALSNGGIYLGLIADGIHVDPSIAVLLQKLAGDKLVLVSDALSPYGLKIKEAYWDTRALLINEGTCHLQDNTLVGTTIPLLEGCKKLASWSKEPAAAIWAATMAPRHLLTPKSTLQKHLLGKPLFKLLRWKGNLDGSNLNWQQAA